MLALAADTHAIEWTLRAAGLVAAVAVIWAKGIRPAYRFVKGIDEGVQFVKAQMENNGGSSQRDAIDRIEALATTTVERLDGIDARVQFLEEVHRKQVEVDAIVAANAAKLARPRPYLPPRESA